MKKITILSGDYWKNLGYDLFNLFKFYPVQVIASFIVAALIIFGLISEGQAPIGIFMGVTYFIGTNMLLLIVSEKIEHGFAQNSLTAYLLFGTSTNRLKISYFTFVIKLMVVIMKFALGPLLLVVGLIQYQAILNKIVAEEELKDSEQF